MQKLLHSENSGSSSDFILNIFIMSVFGGNIPGRVLQRYIFSSKDIYGERSSGITLQKLTRYLGDLSLPLSRYLGDLSRREKSLSPTSPSLKISGRERDLSPSTPSLEISRTDLVSFWRIIPGSLPPRISLPNFFSPWEYLERDLLG